MKDEAHHLKSVQKKVLRSLKKESNKTFKEPIVQKELPSENQGRDIIYDEVITSDQRVPRAPTRASYH